jgi:hypothetical protein
MKPLYTKEEFDLAKNETQLPLTCINCNKVFYRPKKYIKPALSGTNKRLKIDFCNINCFRNRKINSISVTCDWCGKAKLKAKCEIARTKHNFCNSSCAAKYNNSHKSHGTRRSKLEIWIEKQLKIIYPKIAIQFNCLDAINAELDIYIPSLHLAFELNGIFHYEPIFGNHKLEKIENNDKQKFYACTQKQISLCVIDTSTLIYFKEENAKKFLKIICDIIDKTTKSFKPEEH